MHAKTVTLTPRLPPIPRGGPEPPPLPGRERGALTPQGSPLPLWERGWG
jgi:hypothetical protein